jgi:RND superfamily putative drug exporter
MPREAGPVASFIAGRRTKWIVLAAWLVLLGALAPFASRFEGAQKNEPSSFLPSGTESLEVLEASDRFPSGDATPAVAVFFRDSGLTAADRRFVAGVRASVAADPPAGVEEPRGPVVSSDGRSALLTAPILAEGDEEILIGSVEDLRERLDDAPAGLEAKVTGPAGYSADASAVFEGINSTLLLATTALVFVLLVLIYRSPIFWILPLVAVLVAEFVVRGLGYALASSGLVINGQTGGILLVLVFGAGTDYALLLTARYREELHRRRDAHEAMAVALRRAAPAILASAGTVIAGLLCLSVAQVNGTAGLGPVGAMGIAVAVTAMLTLLPVLLLIGGRRAFWPFVPRYGDAERAGEGFWRRLGERIAVRPRRVWLGTTAALAVLCLGLVTLDDDLTSATSFRTTVEAVEGQRLVERAFPGGASAPAVVLVRDPGEAEAVRAAVAAAQGVDAVGRIEQGDAGARFAATLAADPYSEGAYRLIEPLRETAKAAATGEVLVGGPSAEERDLRAASTRDTKLLVPLVLAVVLAILVLLLRALVAPLLLIGTVVLSFLATLGFSSVVFDHAFGFAGEDPSLPLYAFIFLVALGVDYNIFLMARVREEAHTQGTREGMLRGLAVTGGVITSAGVVLAGTFAVLAVLPFVPLTQVGFAVAVGVLLDTLLVRSVLVPALAFDARERIWWPSRLARVRVRRDAHAAPPHGRKRWPRLRREVQEG